MAIAAALFILLVASPAAVYAASHTVGGSTGWSQSGDYATWTASQTFAVGDTLVFNYDSSHGVDEVNSNDYTNCNTGSPLKSHSGSPTTITLSTAGTTYYICPTFGHCQGGMKLAVTVGAGSTSPSGSPPTTSSPPSTTTTTSPPPPPPASGARGGFGNMNVLVGALALVFAYMG